MQNIRVVYITIPSDEATALAKDIVKHRLAACVNVVPKVDSYFWWEGEIQNEAEALLICKTTQNKLDRMIDFVRHEHPYDLPEIIAVPVAEGLPEYINWVLEETGKEKE